MKYDQDDMDGQAYTLAMYRVKDGHEDEFARVWNKLADTFSALPDPPIHGTLIRHLTDRTLYYSFGPWRSPQHVAAMRANPAAVEGFAKLRTHCEEIIPGDYEIVTHVTVG
jgi:heme-degrading monooxygenase HmoA